MSDIHRFLGPVQWKTEKTSERTIATIISDDVLILPHRANPVGWNFREPQGSWDALRWLLIPVAPFFEPSLGLVSNPIERFGLGLEAGNVLLLPPWVRADHMPLSPNLEGSGIECHFAYGFAHSANMRPIPQGRYS